MRPLYSRYHHHPLYHPLLEGLVLDLPQAVTQLSHLAQIGDFPSLAELAHQMAGSTSTYGFPLLPEALANCEQLIRKWEKSDRELYCQLQQQLKIIHQLVQRVQQGISQ